MADLKRGRGRPQDPDNAREAVAVEVYRAEGRSQGESISEVAARNLTATGRVGAGDVDHEREQVKSHLKRARSRAEKAPLESRDVVASVDDAIARDVPLAGTAFAVPGYENVFEEAASLAAERFCRCATDPIPHYHCEACEAVLAMPNILHGTFDAVMRTELTALVCGQTCLEAVRQRLLAARR